MSLIEAGQLRLPNQEKNGRAEGTHTQSLPYLGAVGTIPLSVSPTLIRHHPGASPNGTEKAADGSR
jgi:hypothetical protein